MMKYFSTIKVKGSPVICNIPHSSVIIPKEFLSDFLVPKKELEYEKKFMADLYTDVVYKDLCNEFGGIISKVSRITVDIERFYKDSEEKMSDVGMGFLYTKTSEGKVLRKISSKRRKEYFDEAYKPYHNYLENEVRKILEYRGSCLIIDCHSFPSVPRIYEPDQKKERPDICIGVDEFHTPRKLKMLLKSRFERAGFSVKYNSPFSGTIVPFSMYRTCKNVYSVMIEINRKLYMDENTFELDKNYQMFSSKVCAVVQDCVYEFYITKKFGTPNIYEMGV